MSTLSSKLSLLALILLALSLGMLLPGCGTDPKEHQQNVLRYAELTGAKASDYQSLVASVEEIEAAAQTPLALQAQIDGSGVTGIGASNSADIISGITTDETRLRLIPQLAELIPRDQFQFSPKSLLDIREMMAATALLWPKLSEAAASPLCRFDVRFDHGFFGRMRFLDDATIASRLHLLAVAPALADDRRATALGELESCLKWCERLSQVKRVEARLLATQLRGEALLAVEAIAGDPATQRADLQQLHALLRSQLDDWPDPAGALVGDRAVTMHAYEAIRDGQLDRLITKEEETMLGKQGLLDTLRTISEPSIDQDEAAYLDAMKVLIAAAGQPLSESSGTIADVLARFDPNGGSRAADAPLATHLFLPGVATALKEIVRDRAVCEGWAITLATAAKLDLPPYRINPLTGQPYVIDRQPGWIAIQFGDPELRNASARVIP